MHNVGSRRRRPRGFSLVEIAMVLSIGALIISGVMLFYQNANMSLMANDTHTEFGVIVSAVHSMYAGVPDYAGLDDAIMFNSPLIPQKWKNPVFGMLQAPYHVPLSMVVLGNNTLFITLHSVPGPICSKLITTDPGPGSWWAVGGGVPYYSSAVGSPFTPSAANVACSYPMGSVADLALGIQ